jgi:hypothetical protein
MASRPMGAGFRRMFSRADRRGFRRGWLVRSKSRRDELALSCTSVAKPGGPTAPDGKKPFHQSSSPPRLESAMDRVPARMSRSGVTELSCCTTTEVVAGGIRGFESFGRAPIRTASPQAARNTRNENLSGPICNALGQQNQRWVDFIGV